MKIMVIGATSAIAEAACRIFAERGDVLYLVGRNAEKLGDVCADLMVRGASSCHVGVADLTDFARHEPLVADAEEQLGGIDTVLIAHGSLPDQKACQGSFSLTRQELEVNGTSVISLLTLLANRFEEQGYGTLAVISSPSGDRGRQSNYVYGAAKGMVTVFLQGLRNRLAPAGVHVLTIKPGFVDTPMTANFEKGFLWASPDDVGRGIVKAIDKKRNVVYLPWFWRYIMLVIRHIPEFVFKRLSL